MHPALPLFAGNPLTPLSPPPPRQSVPGAPSRCCPMCIMGRWRGPKGSNLRLRPEGCGSAVELGPPNHDISEHVPCHHPFAGW